MRGVCLVRIPKAVAASSTTPTLAKYIVQGRGHQPGMTVCICLLPAKIQLTLSEVGLIAVGTRQVFDSQKSDGYTCSIWVVPKITTIARQNETWRKSGAKFGSHGHPGTPAALKGWAAAAPVRLTSQQLNSLIASIMALKHLITCVVAGIDYLVHPQILVLLLVIQFSRSTLG